MARPLFDCWAQIARRVRATETVRLFLDFDGTLAPIRATPGEVGLPPATRLAIQRLVRHSHLHTAIVSGRRRADLISHLGLPGVQYWGMYGWERRAGRALPAGTCLVVARARDRLRSRLSGLSRVVLEDKTLGFSIHFRGAPPSAVRRARACLARELASQGGSLHLVTGRKVWNVLPREVQGKGAAVREAIQRLRSPCLPIYVGDDATDEPAFVALAGGITVRVGGARRTRARYWLSSPRQVRRFIERLDGALS